MIALAGAALCLGACQQNGKTEVTLKMKDGQKAQRPSCRLTSPTHSAQDKTASRSLPKLLIHS